MNEQEQLHQTPDAPKPLLAAGEKGFAVVLLLAGLAAFLLALALWLELPQPRISSAAALPLFVSGLWVVLTGSILWKNRTLSTPLSAGKSTAQKIRAGLAFVIPRTVGLMLLAIALYCGALLLGLSFYVATPLFLLGMMCCLTGGNLRKNALWTVLVMVFLILVFRLLFGVIFP